jgi:hypothetical protein
VKEIETIPLARRKISRRGISEQWVTETISSPEQVVEGYGGRRIAQRRYTVQKQERLLRVVYQEMPEKYIVITAYLTAAVRRYWKEKQ